MIRSSLLAFASLGFLWFASPAGAAQTNAAAVLPLVHFDTPGNQSADVTPVVYHRRHRHRPHHHR